NQGIDGHAVLIGDRLQGLANGHGVSSSGGLNRGSNLLLGGSLVGLLLGNLLNLGLSLLNGGLLNGSLLRLGLLGRSLELLDILGLSLDVLLRLSLLLLTGTGIAGTCLLGANRPCTGALLGQNTLGNLDLLFL